MSYKEDLQDIVKSGLTWEEAREKLANTGDAASNIAKNASNYVLTSASQAVESAGSAGIEGAVQVLTGKSSNRIGLELGAGMGVAGGTAMHAAGAAATAAVVLGAAPLAVAAAGISAAVVTGYTVGKAFEAYMRDTAGGVSAAVVFSQDLSEAAAKDMENALVTGEAFFDGLDATSKGIMDSVNEAANSVYETLGDLPEDAKSAAVSALEKGVESARSGVKSGAEMGFKAIVDAQDSFDRMGDRVSQGLIAAKHAAVVGDSTDTAQEAKDAREMIAAGIAEDNEDMDDIEEVGENIDDFVTDLVDGVPLVEEAWDSLTDSIGEMFDESRERQEKENQRLEDDLEEAIAEAKLNEIEEAEENKTKKNRVWIKEHTTSVGTKVEGYWRKIAGR